MGNLLFSIIAFLVGSLFLLMGIMGGEEINITGQIIAAFIGLILIAIPLGKLADNS